MISRGAQVIYLLLHVSYLCMPSMYTVCCMYYSVYVCTSWSACSLFLSLSGCAIMPGKIGWTEKEEAEDQTSGKAKFFARKLIVRSEPQLPGFGIGIRTAFARVSSSCKCIFWYCIPAVGKSLRHYPRIWAPWWSFLFIFLFFSIPFLGPCNVTCNFFPGNAWCISTEFLCYQMIYDTPWIYWGFFLQLWKTCCRFGCSAAYSYFVLYVNFIPPLVPPSARAARYNFKGKKILAL